MARGWCFARTATKTSKTISLSLIVIILFEPIQFRLLHGLYVNKEMHVTNYAFVRPHCECVEGVPPLQALRLKVRSLKVRRLKVR